MYKDDCMFIRVDREWGEKLGIKDWRKMPRFCRHEDDGSFKNPRPYVSPLEVSGEELKNCKDLDCEGCPWHKQIEHI